VAKVPKAFRDAKARAEAAADAAGTFDAKQTAAERAAAKKAKAAEDRNFLRVNCIKSLEFFILAMDPYFHTRLEEPHVGLCKALTNFRRGLPVTLPDGTVVNPKHYDGFLNFFSRDTYKSTIICEWFPIWLCLYWTYDPGVENRAPAIMLFQAKLDKAELHLKKIKRTMTSKRFTDVFPELVPPHRSIDKWDTQSYLNLHGVDRGGAKEHCIEIAGVTADYTGWHLTDKIVDDAVTEGNYTSVTDQEKVKAGIKINDNILDTDHGLSYFVGTPYAINDANMALTRGEMGRMLSFIVPCFDEDPAQFFAWARMHPTDDGYEEALAACEIYYNMNFPVRLTLPKLAGKFRKQGSKFFTSQQLLDIEDQGSAIFKARWLDDVWVSKQEAMKRCEGRALYMFIDSAWKKQQNKGHGDDTAIGIVGYDKDGDPYLLDLYVSDEMTEAEGMLKMARWVDRYAVARIYKETFGEDDFAGRWRNWCKSESRRLVRVQTPKRSKNVTGKENRIRQLAPQFEMGRYFVCEDIDEVHLRQFREQFKLYAGEGTCKDDILDMMADSVMSDVAPRHGAGAKGDTHTWQNPYRPLGGQTDHMSHAPGAPRRFGWATPLRKP
jgi:hypothetical protein